MKMSGRCVEMMKPLRDLDTAGKTSARPDLEGVGGRVVVPELDMECCLSAITRSVPPASPPLPMPSESSRLHVYLMRSRIKPRSRTGKSWALEVTPRSETVFSNQPMRCNTTYVDRIPSPHCRLSVIIRS